MACEEGRDVDTRDGIIGFVHDAQIIGGKRRCDATTGVRMGNIVAALTRLSKTSDHLLVGQVRQFPKGADAKLLEACHGFGITTQGFFG